MKCSVEFQYANRGQRPQDPGPVDYRFDAGDQALHLLSNVGDPVHFGAIPGVEGSRTLRGVVRSRAFFFQQTWDDEVFCHVNIVVGEKPDLDWGLLIKE